MCQLRPAPAHRLRRGGLVVQQTLLPPQKGDEHRDGDAAADHVGDGGGPDDAEDGQKPVEQEHQRNVQQTLAQNGQQEGAHPPAHRLKEGDQRIGAGGEGPAQAEDPQEGRAVGDGFAAAGDEQADRLNTSETVMHRAAMAIESAMDRVMEAFMRL